MQEQNRSMSIETERKYLIFYPDIALLKTLPGVKIKKIEQTYLSGEAGVTSRVRKIEENGDICYIYTEKRRINSLSGYEKEYSISEKEYFQKLRTADPKRRPIEKIRYAIPYGNHIAEIDVYPFWSDRAILEIELEGEQDAAEIPPFVQVIREVTYDKRYKNVNLAKEIPMDSLKDT